MDPTRFPPNHVEKSPIRPSPVYIMPKIIGIVENVAKNLEKIGGVDGLRAGWVSRVLERGDPKSTHHHHVFDVKT